MLVDRPNPTGLSSVILNSRSLGLNSEVSSLMKSGISLSASCSLISTSGLNLPLMLVIFVAKTS